MSWAYYLCHLITQLLFGLWFLQGVSWQFSGNWAIRLQSEFPKQKILLFLWPPCLAFMFLMAEHIYPWTQLYGHKALYFQEGVVLGRLVLYFILATVASFTMPKLPALGLILCLLVGNFFAVDWSMSLEKNWASSMYGLLYLSNSVLLVLALIIFRIFSRPSMQARTDLVHLLLVSVLFWVYLHFCQFLIIWMGNLPGEVGFYLDRSPVLFSICFGLKLLPSVLIALLPSLKRKESFVRPACAFVFLAGVLEIFWLVRYS